MTLPTDRAERDHSVDVLYVGTAWADEIAAATNAAFSGSIVQTVPDPGTARAEHDLTAFDCVIAEQDLSAETGAEFLRSVVDEDTIATILLASAGAEPSPAAVHAAGLTDYFVVETLSEQYDDLTARVETAVRERTAADRKRLEAGLELADTGAWEYDVATDSVWWTDQARTVHGLSPDRSLTAEDMLDLYAPEDRQALEAAFAAALDEGIPIDETLERNGDDHQWIQIRGKPITRQGKVTYIRGSLQDVTSFRNREKQFKFLHSAGTKLMQATSRDEAAEITIDAAKHILGYNRAALRLIDENGDVLRVFATTKDNVAAAGTRPDYRVDEDVPAAETYRRGEPAVVSDLSRQEDEYERGELRSGLYVPVGDHGVFSCGNAAPNAYDQTDVDIVAVLTKLTATALTRIEAGRELRQKSEQLEDFTGTVAHDLRNPLNVAAGHVDLAREDPAAADFATIQNALNRMEAIIDDLLRLARAGKEIDNVVPVSLAEVADEAFKHAEADGLRMTVTDDIVIDADRRRLLHVFENLFRNAIDHNESPVSVTVGALPATRTSGGESRAGFFVEDDGAGIPPDARGSIFENGYTTLTDGTGFGLSIVRHVADAHGWNIEITASEAGGARFEFTNVPLTSEKTRQS